MDATESDNNYSGSTTIFSYDDCYRRIKPKLYEALVLGINLKDSLKCLCMFPISFGKTGMQTDKFRLQLVGNIPASHCSSFHQGCKSETEGLTVPLKTLVIFVTSTDS